MWLSPFIINALGGFMKTVLFVVVIATSVFSLEMKVTKLPPVDGSIFNGSVWVQQ
jgi:Na+-translocating ferredoxin:NAD+ oxidoreductase RnfA subunit